MVERYFVKELNPKFRYDNSDGEKMYFIVYEGEDSNLARRIAENLEEAHVFTYDWSATGILVSDMVYRNGESRGFETRGMDIKNPLVSLVQNNVMITGPKPSMSELLARFTPREREFLNSLVKAA